MTTVLSKIQAKVNQVRVIWHLEGKRKLQEKLKQHTGLGSKEEPIESMAINMLLLSFRQWQKHALNIWSKIIFSLSLFYLQALAINHCRLLLHGVLSLTLTHIQE